MRGNKCTRGVAYTFIECIGRKVARKRRDPKSKNYHKVPDSMVDNEFKVKYTEYAEYWEICFLRD